MGSGSPLARRNVLLGLDGVLTVARPVEAASPFAALEQRSGGRLGVHALDTGTRRTLNYRADERFAMASTFKALLAGAVLARVDEGAERLDRSIAYGQADLLDYAPVTTANVGQGGMTVEALCAAAIGVSDNTAGNLLLATLGGPGGLTGFARRLGDRATRLDRTEPSLNEARPGDPRDTTTPQAMADSLQKLLLGEVLKPASREKLIGWMTGVKTGLNRLRKGAPTTWRVADKTGSGGNGTINDIGVLWRPVGRPIIIAAYINQTTATTHVCEGVLADVSRLAVASFAPKDVV